MSGADPEQNLDEIVVCCEKIIKLSTNQPTLRSKTLKSLQDILRVLLKSGSTSKKPASIAAKERESPVAVPSKSAPNGSASKLPSDGRKSEPSISTPLRSTKAQSERGHQPVIDAESIKKDTNHKKVRPHESDYQDENDENVHKYRSPSESEYPRNRRDEQRYGRDNRDERDHNHDDDYHRRDDRNRYNDRDERDYDRERGRNRGKDYADSPRENRRYEPIVPNETGFNRDSHKPTQNTLAQSQDRMSPFGSKKQFMSALSTLHGGPTEDEIRLANMKKESLKREWEEQIREKKEREAREKERIRRLEEKEEREMQTYNPYGKGGAGAPYRDDSGNVIGSRRPAGKSSQFDRDNDRNSREEHRRSPERESPTRGDDHYSRKPDSYYGNDQGRDAQDRKRREKEEEKVRQLKEDREAEDYWKPKRR